MAKAGEPKPTDAYSALRNAGFREAEVRQMLQDIRPHVGAGANVQTAGSPVVAPHPMPVAS